MAIAGIGSDDVVAVTGPGGFIGGAVCRAALEAGAETIGIGPGDLPAHPRLRRVEGLVTDSATLAEQIAGAGMLVHAAGQGTPTGVDRFDGGIAVNELQLAARVLEAALQAGVRKLVLVSSGGTVYGAAGGEAAITEAQPAQPISRYGAVKAMIEQMALTMSRAALLECVVARVSNPYGPGQRNLRGQGLVATLFERLIAGEPIQVWGDGSLVRDYVYVDDVAHGLLAAASLQGGTVCNVSSGEGRSVAEVIRDVSRALGVDPVIERLPWKDAGVPRNVLCNALLTQATGWRPSVGWQEGLARTVAWWRPGAAVPKQHAAAAIR